MESEQGVPSANLSSPPTAAGCHRLPQLPTMGRNVRTAQSKSSAKHEFKPRDEAAVLHVEGTSKVIKILTDSISEYQCTESENKESLGLQLSANSESKDTDLNTSSTLPNKKKRSAKAVSGGRTKKDASTSSIAAVKTDLVSNKPDGLNSCGQKNTSVLEDEKQVPSPDLPPSCNLKFESKDVSSDTAMEDKIKKKKESPLEKKKRTSKMGVDVKNVETMDTTSDKSMPHDETKMPHGDTDIEEAESGKTDETLPKCHIPRCVLILPTEVPTESQLEKLLAMDSTAYNLQCAPLWQEGDMLWAKVSGHPYWPCMVSKCPFTKMFTRIKGDVRIIRSYHVQFFGNEVERGWVNEPSLMLFEGKLNFLEKAQTELTRQCKRGKSAYNPYKINISRRHAWNIAVDEAEQAMALSLTERKVQFTFEYVFMDELKKEQQLKKEKVDATGNAKSPKQVTGAKRKRTSEEKCSTTPVQQKNKRRKLDVSSLVGTPIGAETSFDAYYANHRSTVIEKHPEWDTTFVFEYLRQQWEKEKKKTSKEPLGTPSQSTPTGSIKRGRPAKLKINAESSVADSNSEIRDESITSQPRKRGRSFKNIISQPEPEETPAPLAINLDSEENSAIDEESSRPKIAASALSARKVSQESDSSTESKGKGLRENEPYELEIFKLNTTCKIDKDKICVVCEKNCDVFECSKNCGQHFHPSCVNCDPQDVAQYVCSECTSGIHACFSCKKADMETIKCSVNLCGKYYHEDCIKKYRLTRWENKGFVCPLHTCATCAVDNIKNPKAIKGRFYRCIRCPTAYHVGDFCVAAGSVNLAGTYIVCSDHFQPNRSLSCHSRLNITWCFSCSKGGTLLCCETCPAAFHAECVKVEKTPEEAWFCMDCAAGRKPLYGNIVWIKVGNYRWWPGEICHPRHVPLNIQEKAHQVGEFPVRFFGSHDYYWIHRGRVFLFQEGDKGSKEGSSRGLFKIYMKGVKEATEAFKLWTAAKAKKVEQEQERYDKKPAPYKFIKSNVPIGSVQIYKAELSEIPRCECKPDQEDACTSDCLNKMMMYECHPAVCPAGEKCHNQRFQKRQYPECEPFKSEARGWGLKCLEDIKKGQFVQEYVGDLIDEEECKRRIEQAHDDNITNFYMLTMDKNRIIDAGPKGNYSRFMNHSCCPNLETQKWMVNGDIRVGLFALCNISKGSELTFNYNLECLGNEKKACACGSDNCSGFLGVRPKTAAATANEKKAKEAKKKRRKKKLDPRKEHEDDCYRCGEGGELVMCDKGNCPKVYHLQCLKLTKPPSGKWLCPWHHCDECGKPAISKCSECPNSYCAAHIEGNMYKVDGLEICSDHTDLIENSSQSLDSSSVTGANGVKSEVESNSSESDAADSKSTESAISKATEDSGDNSIQVNSELKTEVADETAKNKVKSSSIKSLSLRTKKDDGKTTLAFDKPSSPSNMPAKSEVIRSVSSNLTESTSMQTQTSKASLLLKSSELPVAKTKGNITRTKARYRARLTQNKITKLKNASILNTSSENPQNAMEVHESDDNDSISDLVIDIP
ncbi:histone-lysine N-methyltransferase NSD2-like [Physella acuta]|uniref:histone-lysine N-methyltransferase NSD2-like n=1 Tax=Physella acuta TaxID=109671 RepID=UPI0027DABE16|nr:histone-lysine N-methyltransferase NSD2-like [Physella acuta]